MWAIGLRQLKSAGISSQSQAMQVLKDSLVPVGIRYSSSVTETGDSIAATSSITAPVSMAPSTAVFSATGGAGSFQLQSHTDYYSFHY